MASQTKHISFEMDYKGGKRKTTKGASNGESILKTKETHFDMLERSIMENKRVYGDGNQITTDDVFRLLDLHFYKKFYAYRHLQNSYDKFIDESLVRFFRDAFHVFAEVIDDEKTTRHRIVFTNIKVSPPKHSNNVDPMFPADARHLSLTYSLTIHGDAQQIKETIYTNKSGLDKTKIKKVGHSESIPLVHVPVLIRSKNCSTSIYKDETKDECKYDPGGYFIVNGAEKVVISQDRMVDNHPLVFIKKMSNISYYVVQVNSRSRNLNDTIQTIHIKMKKDNVMAIKVPILNEINVMVLFKAMGIESDRDIIGYCTYDSLDLHMIEYARKSLDACINDNDDEHRKIVSREDALDYLITKMRVVKKYTESNQVTKMEQKKLHLIELLKNTMFPHIEGTLKDKAHYLGYVINRLLRVVLGRVPPDDRDSYVNKRVDCIDDLFMEIFKQQYKNVIAECNKQFMSRMADNLHADEPYNIIYLFKSSVFEQGFKASLTMGTWPRKVGVSQKLDRYSYLLALSFLSRVDSQSGGKSSSRLNKPRQVNSSNIGFLCPVQTPEHAKVGLIKHLSLIGSITIGDRDNYEIVKEWIKTYPNFIEISDVRPDVIKNMYKIFLNGEWIGLIENVFNVGQTYRNNPALKMYAEAKVKKLTGQFDSQSTSVIIDNKDGELRFYTDSGRFYRPVLRVNGDNELVLTKEMINNISLNKTDINKITDWNDFYMIPSHPIEYLDSTEQPFTMISYNIKNLNQEREKLLASTNFKFTGCEATITNRYDQNYFVRYNVCEIHPSVLLGEIAGNIPDCHANQGPRNTFQVSQGKQGQCIPLTTYRSRTDITYVLYNPQTPIVSTRIAKYTNIDVMTPGENVMVAIDCNNGFNQEDSIMLNGTAVDRGLFRSMNLKKYGSVIQKNQETSSNDIFMKPPQGKLVGEKYGCYDKLNEDGFVPEETTIVNNDVIFGKVTPLDNPVDVDKIYRDSSEQYKSFVPGVVDRVYTGIRNQDGYLSRKALVRSERIPRMGDKFCCYTPDHEVLTTDGWIKINELTKEHQVACLIDDKLCYEKPTELQEYDYNGKMYAVETNHVSLVVTPNHRMYTKTRTGKVFKIETAESILNARRKYKKNVDLGIVQPGLDKFTLPACEDLPALDIDIDAWLTLFGVWMAEGCTTRSFDTHDVRIATHKERVKEALEEANTKLNFNIRKNKSSKTDEELHCWRVSDKRLVAYLKVLSVGATNKYLPTWVWQLNRDQCRTLINGMMLGDGHTMANGTRRYDTSSLKLANDFQRLCLHAGYATNIALKYKVGHVAVVKKKGREGEKITLTANAYRMTIIETQTEPIVNKTVSQDSMIDYEGKVYCCTVPGTGIIYVRRNFMPVWCGNSKHGQKGTTGIILDAADMPYNKYGVRPDIIINPNAIPSRMTIGQLIECISGKVGGLKGCNVDGTPFEDHDIEKIKDELESLGYHRSGDEYLYDGMTGRKIKNMIFFGPTFYQRLKHLTEDKIHCLTADHEISTYSGWKQISAISDLDLVKIWSADKSCAFSHPIAIHKYNSSDFEDQLLVTIYWPHSKNILMKITLEHKLFVSVRLDVDLWSRFELISVGQLIQNYTQNEPCLNVKMVAGNSQIIVGPFAYTITSLTEPVYCISVPNERILVRSTTVDNYVGIWTGNSRARGPTAILTRQAPEGRSRDGGLRIGEMERDVIIAHGMALFLKEIMVDCADAHTTHVCGKCGLFAIREEARQNKATPGPDDIWYCPQCENYNDIHKIIIPYAFKLMLQELMSMCIAPRIRI